MKDPKGKGPGADDFWKDILSNTLHEAADRLGRPEDATVYDDTVDEPDHPSGDETLWDESARDETVPEDATAPAEVSASFRATMTVVDDTAPEQSTPSPASGLSLRPGDLLLDTYRMESDSIEGGMGAVWRVHHTGWDVDLAMKRPKPAFFVTESQKQDFTRECERWIKLGLHPNIVTCYYVREIGGVPTIFSEWMSGGSVERRIRDGSLYEGAEPEVRARLLDIAIQFARGLRYAHENDLVHQDVKPDNLLLGEHWEAKVSDFGLAKARSVLTQLEGDATALDSDATVVTPAGGKTPAYCSPEQAEGLPLTKRTDLYSWAVSVMELYLGGKPWAHPGQLTGPLAGIACRDYFTLACIPIPEALRDLLAHCMEQEERHRPRDFRAVEPVLLDIYRQETGEDYPRPEPKAAADTADSRNNRALSYIDLGMTEDAVALWDGILMTDPGHVDARFNRELYLVRSGEKLPSEAEQALEQYPATKRSGVSAAFRRCYPTAGQKPESFLTGSEKRADAIRLSHVLRSEDRVCFVGNTGDTHLNGYVTGSFSLTGRGEDLELYQCRGSLDELVGKHLQIRFAVLCADRRHAILLVDRNTRRLQCAVCYDMEQDTVVRIWEQMPNLFLTGADLSRNDSLLALSDADGKAAVFALPEMTPLWEGKGTFLGFLPDGRCLLREKVTGRKEALVTLDEAGSRTEVYRFQRVLDACVEFCGPEGLFLAYRNKTAKQECFLLDSAFRPSPIDSPRMCRELFSADRVLFYESDTGLLVLSSGRQVQLWNWKEARCLYGVVTSDWNSHALFDAEHRGLLLYRLGSFAVWTPLPLPAAPAMTAYPEWRLSRVVTSSERFAEEDRLGGLIRAFDAALARSDVSEIARIHRDCLEIPGFGGSEQARRMERHLARVARKRSLRAVRCVGTEPWPEELNDRTRIPCAGGLFASCQMDSPQSGVRLRNGRDEHIATLSLPASAAWVSVRGEQMLAFGKKLDVVEYDLTGKALYPDRPAPAQVCAVERNNPLKYGWPELLDVDLSGQYILYGLNTPFDMDRHRQERGVFCRDLRTGHGFRVAENYEPILRPVFLSDGTVLVPPMDGDYKGRHPELVLRRYRPADGRELDPIRLGRGTRIQAERFVLVLSPARDRFVVSFSAGTADWNLVFDAGGRELSRWKDELNQCRFLPGDCLCGQTRTGVQIRNFRTGRLLYTLQSGRTFRVRTDGRELWTDSGENNHYLLEYDYEA